MLHSSDTLINLVTSLFYIGLFCLLGFKQSLLGYNPVFTRDTPPRPPKTKLGLRATSLHFDLHKQSAKKSKSQTHPLWKIKGQSKNFYKKISQILYVKFHSKEGKG